MSLEQLLLGGILLAFIIGLIRAANVLSENPYQQIKAHEDLAGKLEGGMAIKRRLLDWRGLTPSRPQRIYWLIVAICGVVALTVLLP